jgi:alpha-tubulin suppressor-like RCC1 family protein
VKGGAAYAWGSNAYGNVGNGTLNSPVTTPQPVSFLSSSVVAITGGLEHGSAIKNGAVYSWGTNNYGQVGDGTSQTRLTPVPTNTLTGGITAVVSGGEPDHSFAIQGGAVYAWGYANNFGDLGTGNNNPVTSPVALPSLSSGVTAVATGYNNGAAIRNGAVYAWGFNLYGAVGDGTYTERDTPTPILSMTSGVTSIACGRLFTLAVKDGAVYGWGYNGLGQLGLPTATTTNVPNQILPATDSIVAVAAGENSSYALSSDGSLWAWGYNAYGQLGNGNTTNQTSPVQIFAPAGLRFSAISAESNTALAMVTNATAAPEPAGLALSAIGSLTLLCRRRQAKHAYAAREGRVAFHAAEH